MEITEVGVNNNILALLIIIKILYKLIIVFSFTIDKEKQSSYLSENKKSINKIATSYYSLNIENSCETVNNDSCSSNNQLSIACKSQVFGRLHTRKSMIN